MKPVVKEIYAHQPKGPGKGCFGIHLEPGKSGVNRRVDPKSQATHHEADHLVAHSTAKVPNRIVQAKQLSPNQPSPDILNRHQHEEGGYRKTDGVEFQERLYR